MSAPARRQLYTADDIIAADGWLASMVAEAIHTEITHVLPSEWAEEKRVIPEGLSPFPGPFNWQNSPLTREILDCLSPLSPVREIAVMKGTQISYTVAVLENGIGYMIDCEPGPAMFVSGDKEMAESAVELRIDRMIQGAGIGHKIFSQTENSSRKRTGDTKKKKEFAGGFLLPAGPNSAAKLRQFSVRYLFLDEVDAYPESTQGEGDPLALLKRRTDSFEATRKIIYGSTPLDAATSKIEPLFKAGDQRLYHVPCKACGELQPLEWDHLKYKKKEDGSLDYESVHYECRKCKAEWKNNDKAYFLKEEGHGGAAKWIPTAKATRPGLRSYHISSLYAVVGTRSWESIVEEWVEMEDEEEKRRAFYNTVLGRTYQAKGEAPRWERIMLRREPYRPESRGIGRVIEAEWPEGALLLTLATDIQKNRIEAELVAWGVGKESWSLGYFILAGDTENENDPAWDELEAMLQSPHAGHMISLGLIDSGYNTPAVYKFCERFEAGVLPVKGDPRVRQTRRAFAVRDVPGYLTKRVDLDVDFLKQEVYGNLGRERSKTPDAPPPPGYCHFPEEYGEDYFRQLVAEERVLEKNRAGFQRWVWTKPPGRRNEALDCRVYNLAALYVLAAAACNAEDGSVDWATFWEVVAEQNS